jgi:hypothetical protein
VWLPGNAVDFLGNPGLVGEVVEPTRDCRSVDVAGFRAFRREQIALNPRNVPPGDVFAENDRNCSRAVLSFIELDVRFIGVSGRSARSASRLLRSCLSDVILSVCVSIWRCVDSSSERVARRSSSSERRSYLTFEVIVNGWESASEFASASNLRRTMPTRPTATTASVSRQRIDRAPSVVIEVEGDRMSASRASKRPRSYSPRRSSIPSGRSPRSESSSRT